MIVGIIRRKPVLTYASIIFGNMLASVNSVNSVNRKKNLLNSNILDVSSQYGELRPTSCCVSLVWATPANFIGFRIFAALLHGTLVVGVIQICGVEERAPPIFGRAAITLGIAHILVRLNRLIQEVFLPPRQAVSHRLTVK